MHRLIQPARVRRGNTDVQMVVVSLSRGIVTARVTAVTAATNAVSVCFFAYYVPAPGEGALSDDARSVFLSRTLNLSREQRGLGRLKLAQR